jgi:hypothetical protein
VSLTGRDFLSFLAAKQMSKKNEGSKRNARSQENKSDTQRNEKKSGKDCEVD